MKELSEEPRQIKTVSVGGMVGMQVINQSFLATHTQIVQSKTLSDVENGAKLLRQPQRVT